MMTSDHNTVYIFIDGLSARMKAEQHHMERVLHFGAPCRTQDIITDRYRKTIDEYKAELATLVKWHENTKDMRRMFHIDCEDIGERRRWIEQNCGETFEFRDGDKFFIAFGSVFDAGHYALRWR
jgi:hypothetical protein